ncbi:MAG: hypothetical protein ACQETI_00235 [Halobacteriota archaeon]
MSTTRAVASRTNGSTTSLCVDVTDLQAREVRAYVRSHQIAGTELRLERKGTRTFLVADPVE